MGKPLIPHPLTPLSQVCPSEGTSEREPLLTGWGQMFPSDLLTPGILKINQSTVSPQNVHSSVNGHLIPVLAPPAGCYAYLNNQQVIAGSFYG